MTSNIASINELNGRSREIFQHIVDSFLSTGSPMGSKTLSKLMSKPLSPASIRNIMADMESSGLLYSMHKSAGRLPTELGLRMFVSGLLEVGRLGEEERKIIDKQCAGTGRSVDSMLKEAISTLSGLSGCAGMVLAPKTETSLKHVEFVNLSSGRALVVIVTEDGIVENRIIDVPVGLPPSVLNEASKYLNSRLNGYTIEEAKSRITKELKNHKAELDELAKNVVEKGLATWTDSNDDESSLIVHGQSNLLEDVKAVEDIEKIRSIFDALDTKKHLIKLLDLANRAEGTQIFIGAENSLFDISGCSMITAPYKNSREQIIGAIGVIGPSRMNYSRIIPLVDYTSKLLGRLIG
ncbi:MAG: heat-inducible transcriptional repressor HrcA [Alphaproteobacteria bacterium]|nr:heat-inducible transcriptional repressor HrcA [Alphaproteobacteria bacterium]